MDEFYVYVYIDPRDGTPFYIGKGRDARAYKHLQPGAMETGLKSGWFFYRKLRKLLNGGVSPVIHFLCENLTEDQALYWETFFIKALGRRDIKTGCLCNHTDGGDGVSHAGHTHSEETKKLIAEKLRVIRTGWKLSDETREKIGNRHRGRKHTDETKARMADGQKMRFTRQEERDKMASHRVGKRASEATLKKMSEAQKGRRHSDETRRKMSEAPKSERQLAALQEANRCRKNSPESLAKQSFTKWKKHWLKSGGTARLDFRGV